MDVVASPDTGFHGVASGNKALGEREVFGMRDLDIVAVALNHGDAQACPFGDLGIVGELPVGGRRAHMG
ncbi:hypothetical protein D9M68_962320 [compost metagenome]